jgi:hypothetical protein
LKLTRLSCHDFNDNQVRLQLFALAYNLVNFLRCLALPKKMDFDGISHKIRKTLLSHFCKVLNQVI